MTCILGHHKQEVAYIGTGIVFTNQDVNHKLHATRKRRDPI